MKLGQQYLANLSILSTSRYLRSLSSYKARILDSKSRAVSNKASMANSGFKALHTLLDHLELSALFIPIVTHFNLFLATAIHNLMWKKNTI